MEAIRPALISVVIPAYNEAVGIGEALAEIGRILQSCQDYWEIIVVDDGSTDGTFDQVCELAEAEVRLKGLRLSRNFGKEAALKAGLNAASGEVIITMDADLQHPPQLIPALLQKWREGSKVVHAVKRNRPSDRWVAKARAALFNTVLMYTSGMNFRDASDYKLLDRVTVNALIHKLPEYRRFYRGLVAWVGYSQSCIPFDVEPRQEGESKWTGVTLLGLAITAITSFTVIPLRLVTILGLISLVIGFFIATEALWSWFQGNAVSGFVTIIITLLFVGSSIMISLGIIGEYIAKIYEEIKDRPSYLVETTVGLDESEPNLKTRGKPATRVT